MYCDGQGVVSRSGCPARSLTWFLATWSHRRETRSRLRLGLPAASSGLRLRRSSSDASSVAPQHDCWLAASSRHVLTLGLSLTSHGRASLDPVSKVASLEVSWSGSSPPPTSPSDTGARPACCPSRGVQGLRPVPHVVSNPLSAQAAGVCSLLRARALCAQPACAGRFQTVLHTLGQSRSACMGCPPLDLRRVMNRVLR